MKTCPTFTLTRLTAPLHQQPGWPSTRTIYTLLIEQQAILNTNGGVVIMEGYGGYLPVRYLVTNPDIPARTRRQAKRIANLWVKCSDGENGYRSNWLRTHNTKVE